jgi:hypothetical protein
MLPQIPDEAIRMKRKLRMRITRVSQQTIRVSETVLRARCPQCNSEVVMLQRVHSAEAPDGCEDKERFASRIDAYQLEPIQSVTGSQEMSKEPLTEKGVDVKG